MVFKKQDAVNFSGSSFDLQLSSSQVSWGLKNLFLKKCLPGTDLFHPPAWAAGLLNTEKRAPQVSLVFTQGWPASQSACLTQVYLMRTFIEFLNISGLLTHNSHTIQATRLKCSIQWVLVYLQSIATITTIHFRTFHHSKEKLHTHQQSLPIICQFPAAQAITHLLSVATDLPILSIHKNGII